MQKYQNVVIDTSGNSIPSVTVTVYEHGTTTPASIYSDNGVTPKANPFTTGVDGGIVFYARDGRYDIRLSKTGYTFGTDLYDTQLFDFANGPNINVTEFGARGDNTTDDSAAIQAALDALSSGGTLVFPGPATYLIGTGLNLYSSQHILFLGGAQLRYTGSGYAVTISAKNNIWIQNMKIVGTSAGAAGVFIYGIQNSTIEDLTVTGFSNGVGVKLYSEAGHGNYYSHFRRWALGSSTAPNSYGIYVSDAAGTNRNNSLIFDQIVSNYNTNGNRFENCNCISFRGNIEQSGSYGLYLDNAYNFNAFVYFENNAGTNGSASGGTAVVAAATGQVSYAHTCAGGTGYVVGDVVKLTGQTSGASNAYALVRAVSGGAPTTLHMVRAGSGYTDGETVDLSPHTALDCWFGSNTARCRIDGRTSGASAEAVAGPGIVGSGVNSFRATLEDLQGYLTPQTLYLTRQGSDTAVALVTGYLGCQSGYPFSLRADGRLEWGTQGASARDTNLYRSGVNSLKTDDYFEAAGGVGAVKYDSGFVSRSDNTISLSTRTVTVAPTGSSFTIYTGGVRWIKTGDSTCQTTFPDTTGLHYIYFDTDGQLKNSMTSWDLTSNVAPVATVYWTEADTASMEDERHSALRNKSWHQWSHDTIGTRYESGLTGTFTISTMSVTRGTIHDEDIEYDTGATRTSCRLWYRYTGGASWTFDAGASTPLKQVTGALVYDNGGTLTALSAGQYGVWYVLAATAVDPAAYSIHAIIGQSAYGSLAAARAAAGTIPTIPFGKEFKHLYTLIAHMQGSTPTYDEAIDYRLSATLPGAGSSTIPASNITFLPYGNVTATNVQNAIEQAAGRWGAAASVSDGGTIAHGLGVTPTVAFVQPTVSGEFASVTSLDSTNITVAIKKHDGTAGTTQTIYWHVLV